ncbi:uncharacterized protein SAPINGB_P005171 [Magnusiomyces paraingens]|uniref:Cystathionine gamma-synthase n=1 Tax=Magnusiomyces paraingens TaxID=2606893 RepID=A0A5E8C0Z9_9ASCO|nr:uncharacterized protein SAPINGB_P005171 [Saprochaete ingens]VVT56600.1 unnamed protein product [Saprochaete ingens]
MSPLPENLSIASLQVHADDDLAVTSDVAAPLHVSTTFRYPSNPADLQTAGDLFSALDAGELSHNDIPHIYSRYTQPVSSRAEAVLSKIIGGHAVLYSSGLSAFHAAMIYYNPKNVFIGDGYHGCHGILHILERNNGTKIHSLDADPEILQPGDVIHLETPVNPTGLAFDITHYAKIAHDRKAFLVIDATFAPPPLQDPFKWGADLVMHSATKYFGGHSDLLAGVLVTKDPKVETTLKADRNYIGTITASLESWLLLRSLRTYSYRIKIQAESANAIVKYFYENRAKFPVLKKIYHSSVQVLDEDQEKVAFIKEQLPLGGGPVFSIEVADEEIAKTLPSKTSLFHHATSLGGVESLIEWRAMSDPTIQRTLLRISVGVEDTQDLINDLSQAFNQYN